MTVKTIQNLKQDIENSIQTNTSRSVTGDIIQEEFINTIDSLEALTTDYSVFFNKNEDTLDEIVEGSTNKHFTFSNKNTLENIEVTYFNKNEDSLDEINEGSTNKHFTSSNKDKLTNIESNAEVNTINSDPSTISGADQITNIISLTQAEYDAIGTPDSSTFYVITDNA